jgi:hypothetical protein
MNQNIPSPSEDSGNSYFLKALIDAAGSAHPAFRYAIVVSGLASIVVVFSNFGINPPTIIFGILILIGLMITFIIFVRISEFNKRILNYPAQIILWTVTFIIAFFLIILTTSAVFDVPFKFKSLINSYLPPAGPVVPGGNKVPSPAIPAPSPTESPVNTAPGLPTGLGTASGSDSGGQKAPNPTPSGPSVNAEAEDDNPKPVGAIGDPEYGKNQFGLANEALVRGNLNEYEMALQNSCKAGYDEGCDRLGSEYLSGDVLKKNIVSACDYLIMSEDFVAQKLRNSYCK